MTWLQFCAALVNLGFADSCPDLTQPIEPRWYQAMVAYVFPTEEIDRAASVAWCETRGIPWDDQGDIIGILQIHWPTWEPWLADQGWTGDLLDPLDNLRAGLLINQEYDAVRHGRWWVQWQCQPGWVDLPE